MKKLFGGALLAFAAFSLGYAVFHQDRPARTAPLDASPPPAPKPKAPAAVIARYCHGHARCSNCIKIEQYSREAVEKGFAQALASGRLKFETVNVEEPANRHYVEDYGLYTKSLVLVGPAGRYKVLNGVWDRLDDKAAFLAYVRTETEGFLKQP